jgi:putative component of membrane protein insertase Oxa1/YidC/SpoIIIJ protein YidD
MILRIPGLNRNVLMRTVLTIFFVCLSFNCLAQKQEDIKKFQNLFAEKSEKHNWGNELKNNKNELTFIFSATFVLYKAVISSQDIDACVFTPSCSVYAIESIKREGVLVGFFSAIDRLTRCNPGRNKDLPVDLKTGKYYDPVEQ